MAKKIVSKKAVKSDNKVTGVMVRILQALSKSKGELTRAQIGEKTEIKKGFSANMRKLEALKYITSNTYEETPRAIMHGITASGKKFVETTDIVPVRRGTGSGKPKAKVGKAPAKKVPAKAKGKVQNKPAKKAPKPVKTEPTASTPA